MSAKLLSALAPLQLAGESSVPFHLLSHPRLGSPLLFSDRQALRSAPLAWNPWRERVLRFVGVGLSKRVAIAPLSLLHPLLEEHGFADALLSIRLGTHGPEQKLHVTVLSRDGFPAAHLKLGIGSASGSLLDHEAEMLEAVRPFFPVPETLAHGTIGNGPRYLLQRYAPPHRSIFLEPSLLERLQTLQTEESMPVHQSSIWERIEAGLPFLPAPFQQEASFLQATVRAIFHFFEGQTVPRTILHGDFAPWNVCRLPEGLGLIDWEHAIPDGLPGLDLIHWKVQVGLLLKKQSPRTLVRSLLSELASSSPLPLPALLKLYFCWKIARTSWVNGIHGFAPNGEGTAMDTWFQALRVMSDERDE